jgi:hypothetical protein
MNTVIRWTEDQLVEEISGLDAMLTEAPAGTLPGTKVAQSYLRQLLKDRRDTLRLLQYRKSQGMSSLRAQAGY